MHHCLNAMPEIAKGLRRKKLKMKNVEDVRTPESLSDVETEIMDSHLDNSSHFEDRSSGASSHSSDGHVKEENHSTAKHAGSLKSEIQLMRSRNELLKLANEHARLALEQSALQHHYQDMMSMLNKPVQMPPLSYGTPGCEVPTGMGHVQNYNNAAPGNWYQGMDESTCMTPAPLVYCIAVPMAEHSSAVSTTPTRMDNHQQQASCYAQPQQQQQQRSSRSSSRSSSRFSSSSISSIAHSIAKGSLSARRSSCKSVNSNSHDGNIPHSRVNYSRLHRVQISTFHKPVQGLLSIQWKVVKTLRRLMILLDQKTQHRVL